MSTAKPIRLEFMVEKGKLTADFSAAANAMATTFATTMGAGIARVEAQLAKLNKVGLGAWNVDATNASINSVTTSITRAEAAIERFNRKARAAAPTTATSTASAAPTNAAPAPSRSFAQVVSSNPVLSDAYDRAQSESLSARLRSLGDDMVRLGGAIYVFKSIGNAIDAWLIDPFMRLGKAMIDVTDENRKFELSISGVLGGMGKAREVNDSIHAMVKDLPLTIRELQDATRGMSFIPALGSKMASGNLADINGQIKEYATLLQKMAILDPEQGIRGAGVALREAMSGEFRSLRLRFEVSPQQIARTIGKSLDDLARDPSLTLKAVNAFANIFVPDESVTGAGKLYSVRIEKLKDQFSSALRELGNAGVYDDVVNKLEGLERKLFDFFGSDRWRAQAQRISASMSGILDSATRSVGAFLEAATGSKADSIGGVIEGVTRLIERIADTSRGLIPIAQNIGAFVGKIANALATLDSGIGRFSEFDSGSGASRFTKSLLFSDSMGVDDVRREAVSRILQNAGLDRPSTQYAPAASQADVYRTEGLGAAIGQGWRNLTADVGRTDGANGEQVPYLDFSKYGPKLALVAQNLERIVSTLDEGTLRNPTALASALKDSGILAKLSAGTGSGRGANELTDVMKREGSTYNFGAEASGAVQLLGRVSSMRNTERDKLTKLLDQAGGTFTTNLGTDRDAWRVGDIFRRLDAALSRESETYVKALEQATNPEQAAQVRRDLDKLDSRFQSVRAQMTTQLAGTAQDYAVALADSVKELPPNARALILDRIATGRTAFAEQVKGILINAGQDASAVAKQLRIDALPIRDQLNIQNARVAAHLDAIGQGYDLAPSATAEDVVRTVGAFPTPPATIARRSADYLSGDALNQTMATYRAAANGFNPADEKSVAAMASAQSALAGLVAKLREARDGADLLRGAFIEFGQSVEGSLQNSLGDALYGLITRTGKMKDVLINFAHDIARAWSQMAAKMALQSLIGDNATSAGGQGAWVAIAQALGFGAMRLGGGGGQSSITAGPEWGGAAANGAVWQGGFTPLMAFANGGIVNRPVIGLIGEGQHPEAVIPMPGGSVPVTMTGGVGDGGNIYIVANYDEALRHGLRQNKDDIVSIASQDIKRGGSIFKTLRRKGR